MTEAKESYKVDARNRVNRYRNRAVYDHEFIHQVVNSAAVVHVAFPPALGEEADPFPALLPMIGVMAKYRAVGDDDDDDDDSLDLYLHGYVSSRIMRLSTSAPRDRDEELEGLPLTASATIVDGLVLSLTPNSHSYNYRSAVLQGFGEMVTDADEKLFAMRQVTNKVLPQRWEHTRTPPTATEMKTTGIMRVRIVSASGKRRHGQPHDDKHDLKNTDMRAEVWTGIVPVWEQRGMPVKGDEETKTSVPPYIIEALDGVNRENEAKAAEGMLE